MSDEYEYDDGGWDNDDGWLYVDDEFDLPDELAEGQIPEPGYSGTNNEIDMQGYEFDLYEYWDDLAYGDDAYWEYGLPNAKSDISETIGQKRKRVPPKANGSPAKKRKTDAVETLPGGLEPVVFRSRSERLRMYKQDAPLLKGKVVFSFLGDWRERFPEEEVHIPVVKMPVDMQKAAEGEDETPPKTRQLGEDAYAEVNGEEGDWEDEMEDDEERGGIAIDPEMLKSILREKLGSAGLEGMDEAAFMQTIQKMLAGDGDEDDAAGDLANALLGKLTSGPGDEALSGWLSQQGVALEDDDVSSVATGEVAEGSNASKSRHTLQTSPPDSAVELRRAKGESTQMPLHSGSPTASTKKRPATNDDHQPTKKHKKVEFHVPSSGTNDTTADDTAGPPTGDDIPDPTVTSTQAANLAAADVNKSVLAEVEEEKGSIQKGGRKRKASTADEKPAIKMRELKDLGPLPEAPSPAPPAKRTRSARSKASK